MGMRKTTQKVVYSNYNERTFQTAKVWRHLVESFEGIAEIFKKIFLLEYGQNLDTTLAQICTE